MRRFLGILGPVALALAGACHDFDATRVNVPRGTIGEEVYGVFCDRVAGQVLREDMSGASFHGVCHKQGGAYADQVDERVLPPPQEGLRNKDGNVVPLDEQKAVRARSVARINALARHRAELIEALDFIFPDADVATLDTKNRDPKASCNDSGKTRALGRELADMLGRFTELYNDDTLPASTRSMAHVLDALKSSPAAVQSVARFTGREGHRPPEIQIGVVRPILGYPRFRDLAAETLRLLAYDSAPYAPNPPRNPDGSRKRVPGAAYGSFSKMLEAAHHEMRTCKANAKPPLAVERDPMLKLDRLSRPRENLEVITELFTVQDARFGGGEPKFIVKRDPRGFAALSSPVEAPFVDEDRDRLPDVDALGRFITVDGSNAPTPFATPASFNVPRDQFGRAVIVDKPIYDTVDVSHNFVAQLLGDLRPIIDPKRGALMNAIGGAYVALGSRQPFKKTYDTDPSRPELGGKPVVLEFESFAPSSSPLADMMYATGNILGDRGTDDFLAYLRMLLTEHPNLLADVAGEMLAFQEIAKQHPEAKLKENSAFWDEILDVGVEIVKDRSLLEDVLLELTDPKTMLIGNVLGDLMNHKDRMTYDRQNINGESFNDTTKKVEPPKTKPDRNQPDTGWNRSQFQRILHIVAEADGVALCNKEGAIVHARGIPIAGSLDLPLSGTYKECEVFKIDNLAHFYLGSVVGKAQLYFRPTILREGIIGVGAATVDTIQQSGGIQGFWDPPDSKTFRPKPQMLNRLVFFDQANDSAGGGPNAVTNLFTRDLIGPHVGTANCPERIINDPSPSAPDAATDGRVRGLRSCAPGQWLQERHPDALFPLEHFQSFDALAPLIRPFAERNRYDLIVKLFKAVHRHYQSEQGQPPECDSSNPKSVSYCSKSHISSYEPLLGEAFPHGIFRALNALALVMNTTAIPHCSKLDANKQCATTQPMSGLAILADATEALLSPDRAKEVGLKTRLGQKSVKRNDGSENPQVTPIYLMTDALSAIDRAFAENAKTPGNEERLARWRDARSALVDQFLGVSGSGKGAQFVNPTLPKLGPTIIDVLRSQMAAYCPEAFVPPYKRCAWLRDDLAAKMHDTLESPLFSSTMDVLESIRKDEAARRELESLLMYLSDPGSRHEALASLRAALTDQIQLLRNDDDLVPIYHVIAEALQSSVRDEQGSVIQAGLIDAHTSLLSRLAARERDADGALVCQREIDPNQVLTIVLRNIVTPMKDSKGMQLRTPFDVILDVVGDVNRADPSRDGRLESADIASVSNEVSDFLANKERGLEQFYQIIKNGTR